MHSIASSAGARRLFAISIIARLPPAMLSIGLLVHTQRLTGSFAAAGVVTGVYAIALGVGGPLLGRLVDRRGQTSVLLVSAGVAASLLRRDRGAAGGRSARRPGRARGRHRAGHPAGRRLPASPAPRPSVRPRRRPRRLRPGGVGGRADLHLRAAAGAVPRRAVVHWRGPGGRRARPAGRDHRVRGPAGVTRWRPAPAARRPRGGIAARCRRCGRW